MNATSNFLLRIVVGLNSFYQCDDICKFSSSRVLCNKSVPNCSGIWGLLGHAGNMSKSVSRGGREVIHRLAKILNLSQVCLFVLL